MTDEQIIDGLRSYDSHTTKDYFYGYCRTAYNIYDNRYQLLQTVSLPTGLTASSPTRCSFSSRTCWAYT